MALTYTHGREFVRQVCPIIERRDIEALVCHLRCHWPNKDLRGLLGCGHDEAVKAALLCLSMVGDSGDCETVSKVLKEGDADTSMLAEHALWSVWFRAGGDEAGVQLQRAIYLVAEGQLTPAIRLLSDLLTRWPTFAEAYNQRAIAYFLKGEYSPAIYDCEQALRLNAHHFGALADLGHIWAILGRLESALDAYRRALALHPRLEGIRQSIQQVRHCLQQRRAPNGSQVAHS